MRVLTRLGLALALLLVHGWGAAALVSERRAVQPGIWWNPEHSGHGFELQQIRDQLFLLWYTYDDADQPVWYAAQSTLNASGVMYGELLQHHWDGSRIDRSAVVGHVEVQLGSRESAVVNWTVHQRSGSWPIKPFEVEGVLPEVNRSGLWYQQDRPGYGLSLMEQGRTLIAALFYYDEQGKPTWMFGSNRDGVHDLPLSRFKGPCPGCATRPLQVTASSTLGLSLGSENELSFAVDDLPNVAPWSGRGASLRQLSPSFSARAADWQLARFDSDALFRSFLELANEQRQSFVSTIDFSAAPPGRSYSPTNLQESGVDEADRVKTDGRYLYTYAVGTGGQTLPQLRIAEVLDEGLQVLEPLAVDALEGSLSSPGLYLTEDRLVAISSSVPKTNGGVPYVWTDLYAWLNGRTQIQIFDRSNPTAPRSIFKAQQDGHLVASRRIGDQLYLVQRAAVLVRDVVPYPSTDAERQRNREIFAQTPLSQMLPSARYNGADPVPLVTAERSYLPPSGDASLQPEFITVTRINLRDPEQRETLTILGRVAAVYVSSQHLYLASSRYEYRPTGFTGFLASGFAKTDVHQIALGEAGLQVVGTGTVEGYLDRDPDRAPLRFAEVDGNLNVVTVSPYMWGNLGQNRLSVLQPSSVQPGLLATRAVLPNKARPQPIGKPGEMLYGTRYVGDRLYAVTFLTTDPLYSIDLSNPDDPYIRGALEIPGFSDYLHPLPGGLLLGLGLDAKTSGGITWFQGLQLSLFDVNGDAPRELQRMLIGRRGSTSAALYDHHAFADLALPGGRMIGLPGQIHDLDFSVPPNAPDNYYYPHAYSGLLRFAFTGDSPGNARLEQLPPLISRNKAEPAEAYDDAGYQGRPVLFSHGSAYIDRGRFFWMDQNGVQSGPY